MRKSMHDFCSRKVSGYSVPGTGQERVGTELRTFMPQAMMEVMMMTASEWGEGPGTWQRDPEIRERHGVLLRFYLV